MLDDTMNPRKNDAPALEWAQFYLSRDWRPIPVPLGKKAPRIQDWQNLRLTEPDLPNYFSEESNVGVLLGEPSGGLVDIDIDSVEALAVAPDFLPKTGCIFGRAGKPKSHLLYVAEPVVATEKFLSANNHVLVELRSTGTQTVFPSSVHPGGEKIAWDRLEPPARLDGKELRRSVASLAACALVARHWPKQGARHEFALALAGFLLRGGCEEAFVVRFIEPAARAAGDEEWQQRGRDARDTAQTLGAGEAATGRPALEKLLGQDGRRVIDKLRDWLDLSNRRYSKSHQDDSSPSGPYRIQDGCIVRVKQTRDGPVIDPLCNFVATIEEETVHDDGVETTRAFTIKGRLDNNSPLPTARVPASRFSGMAWVPENWGARAVVRAGQTVRDCLREAMQLLSPRVVERRVFTHTGWRAIEEECLYLTASGAIGSERIVEVDLGRELSRYELPRHAEKSVEAMRTSLQLLGIAPLSITAPLWAGVFRAPLASIYPLDLSLWLEGPTGSLKSTLAALFLCHFGQFDRTTLPGTWSSTSNQLERRAFQLKDTLFVVDDYAPSGFDLREIETKASRLLRSQGNLSGRGRLRADLNERPAFPPRGLILSTGERHPPGQSILARTLLIEIERKDIDIVALSAAQEDAARLAHAMAGYISWLSPQISQLPVLLRETFEGARAQVNANYGHLRIPEALAQLWIGLHSGLTYAEEMGACSPVEAKDLRTKCWQAFLELGQAQGQLVEEERPSRRFLQVLATLLTQGRALLLPKSENGPDSNERADFLGWRDEERIYLLPEAAYMAIWRFCKETGEPFSISRDRLKRDLQKEGISQTDSDRLTATVWIAGRSKRVLRLNIAAVESLIGEDFPAAITSPHLSHHFGGGERDAL